MDLQSALVAALRIVLEEPERAFGILSDLRREALKSGARATASTVSRTLVFAAKMAGDADAELRFATEWHREDDSQESARILSRIRGEWVTPYVTPSAEVDALEERLVLLVKALLDQEIVLPTALLELAVIRNAAIALGALALAARCLDEIVLAALDSGDYPLALASARELVIEAPSARSFNVLGWAAIGAGERAECRRALEIALLKAIEEGDLVEGERAAAELAKIVF